MFDLLKSRLENHYFLTLHDYMQICNYHYYSKQPTIGAMGDFITAPEISQMFGEMLGIWIITRWHQMGEPNDFRIIEAGPGKGTLMADILRVLKSQPRLMQALRVHFLEFSESLQEMQKHAISQFDVKCYWHNDLHHVPYGPFILIANEFFDALPVQQLVYSAQGWLERGVIQRDGKLEYATREITDTNLLANINPDRIAIAPVPGNILEHSPMMGNYLRWMLQRMRAKWPGSALIVDYGYMQHAYGDTFQAVHHHQYADPLERPGWQDLTVHVNFAAIKDFAERWELQCTGPTGQGDFLKQMGIEQRAQNLFDGPSEPLEKMGIMEAMHRLTDADEMGTLFKVICLSSPKLPQPEGFHAS